MMDGPVGLVSQLDGDGFCWPGWRDWDRKFFESCLRKKRGGGRREEGGCCRGGGQESGGDRKIDERCKKIVPSYYLS
jgi:hypothetical protein